jgi:hypothetical protein
VPTQMFALVQHGDDWRIVDRNGHRSEPRSYAEAQALAEICTHRARWQGLDADGLIPVSLRQP